MSKLHPTFFTHPKIRGLNKDQTLSLIYLLTGPESQHIAPGLIQGGPEIVGLGCPCLTVEEGMVAIDELIRVGIAECDSRARVIRIIGAPEYDLPGNYNVLRGWYRRWAALPDCQPKVNYIACMRGAVELLMGRARSKGDSAKIVSWQEVWDETFGTARVQISRQVDMFGASQLKVESNPSSVTNETNETVNQRTPENTHLNRSMINGIRKRVSDPYTESVKALKDRVGDHGPDATGPGAQLLALYQALYQAAYGQPGSTDPESATWADERVAQSGYAECSARLSRLFATPPHWLEGAITFRTFMRNFDALTEGAGKPKKDIRYGTYEPPPGKKYSAGKHKLKIT